MLQEIADHLRKSKRDPVNGVIYFHSIEGARLQGTDMDNFRLLRAICGEPFYSRVAFVTTRWDLIKPSEWANLEKRNQDLEAVRSDLLPTGPRIFKFLNDNRSHEKVLEYYTDLAEMSGSSDNRGGSSTPAAPELLFAQELERYRRSWNPVAKTAAGKEVKDREKKVRRGGICSFL